LLNLLSFVFIQQFRYLSIYMIRNVILSNVILSSVTIQVNEAIMQNTSDPLLSTHSSILSRETSLWISLYLSVRLIHLMGLSAA